MHPDPQDHVIREQREREAADMATWGCNTARNLVSKSTMSTPNPEQPVPDAGVREAIEYKIYCIMLDVINREIGGHEAAEEVMELLQPMATAPTPATSEDTLMLDWLEENNSCVVKVLSQNSIDPDEWEINDRAYGTNLRQALRAAMAHAGAQKT